MKQKLLLLFFALSLSYWGWGQSYLGLDGGLEGNATIDNAGTTGPSAGKWTKNNAAQTIAIETTTKRSGSSSLRVNNTTTTGRRVWSPLITVSSQTTSVTIQYYRYVANSTNSQSNQEGTYRSSVESLQGTYDTPSAGVWEKQTYSPASATFTSIAGVIMHKQIGTGGDMFIDDMCIYAGSSDIIAPDPPTAGSPTVANTSSTSLTVSWTAPGTGVDNGGYLVVRGTSDPTTAPNVNGIYAVGNAIATGMTVVYQGTETSFIDGGLTTGITYYYRIYTYDKAYNYSTALTGNGIPITQNSPTITVGAITDFGGQIVNTTSAEKTYNVSGTNLTNNITITPPSGFEISTGTGESFVSTNPITLSPVDGSVSATTIYVRFAPTAAQAYSGNITHASSGATTQNVAVSGTGIKSEPSNYATYFEATTGSPSYSAAMVDWTDATGDVLPDGYLIKGSTTSYDAITTPVDGTAETDGGLVKNIAQGTGIYEFTGLNANTTYYFKIFSYTNTGNNINYKTDGSIPQTSTATDVGPDYNVGDYGFTSTSGNWGTTNVNWKQWDGSGWNTTPPSIPTITDNVFILTGNTCVVEVSGKNCKNLTVESGAKLYTGNATMTSPRYVNVSGNILCGGTIGDGVGNNDVISFNIYGGITSVIEGAGTFIANRLRRNSGTGILNLTINMDIELRYNGDALYNATSSPGASEAFNVIINAGKFVNLTGNGVTPTAGYTLKSVDFVTIYGALTINGTLTNNAGNTGLVIEDGASLITNGTVSGGATVRRTFTGPAWHLMSPPVDGQSVFTGSTDMYYYDETQALWVNHNGGSWNGGEPSYLPGKGYLVSWASGATKEFAGTLHSGDYATGSGSVPALTYTSGKGNGFNLVGNPYPSAINGNISSCRWNANVCQFCSYSNEQCNS